ncbi:Crp/Fnr family transcriptional regulator [Leptobacterium sp. I13]|uniref:Crp/Fnr family transcriptional regulator n=1 Tax=Leptobacterium meishanense TaxID=3128904 RepID=UPI0030EEB105
MEKLLRERFGYLFEKPLMDEVIATGKKMHFSQNEIIIDVGQKLTHIPLLLEGQIKILREDGKGDDLLLYFLESGDTCAMSLTCCMNKHKSKIRAIAETDTTVMMIPEEKMQEWFNKYESWRNFVLESYQIRFNEMIEAIDTLAFMKMDERLYKYLTDKVKLNASTIIKNTHQEIADDLHTSRVVISRLLKQLENEQKIKLQRNKIEVLEF